MDSFKSLWIAAIIAASIGVFMIFVACLAGKEKWNMFFRGLLFLLVIVLGPLGIVAAILLSSNKDK